MPTERIEPSAATATIAARTKRTGNRSFAVLLAVRALAPLLVSLVVLGALLLAALSGVLSRGEESETRGRLAVGRKRVERFLAGHLAAARALAEDPVVAAAARHARISGRPEGREAAALESRLAPTHLLDPAGTASHLLRERTALLPEVRSVVFTEAAGVAVGGTAGGHDALLGSKRWWRRAFAAGAEVTLPGPGSGLPINAVSVAVAIPGEGSSGPSGVLQLLVDLDAVRLQLAGPGARAGVAGPHATALVDADGSLVSEDADGAVALADAPAFQLLSGEPLPPPSIGGPNGANGSEGRPWEAARRGRRVTAAAVSTSGDSALRRLTLAVSVSEAAARGPMSVAWGAGLVVLAALAIAAALVVPFLRKASRDLGALVEWARRTGSGEPAPPPDVRRDDEIGDLGAALVSSLEGLRSSRAELERSRRGLEERVAARTAELARVNAELKRRAEELAAASRAKDEFLTNVSHELRTPLNSVIGLTQLVRDGLADSPEESNVFLDQVLASSRHLLSLINDVLDVAKLEAGKVDLDLEDVEPREALAQMADIVRPLAVQKGLVFRCEAADGLPPAHADRRRLVQVLVNLAQNAVKFTEAGQVEVRVRSSDGRRKVLFEVEDTGVGIPAGRRAVVFEKFIQAEAGTTRRFGGTGLGLPISRLLVEAMGGRIGLEPGTGGAGTRVWFTVPAPGLEGR